MHRLLADRVDGAQLPEEHHQAQQPQPAAQAQHLPGTVVGRRSRRKVYKAAAPELYLVSKSVLLTL